MTDIFTEIKTDIRTWRSVYLWRDDTVRRGKDFGPPFGNPILKRLVEEDKTTREIEDWPNMQEEHQKTKMVCPRQREWS